MPIVLALRGDLGHFFDKSYIFTYMNCFVTQKTVVVGSIFLLSEFVVTTPDKSKA